jgi:hypothetical protein
MPIRTHFGYAKRALLAQLYDSMAERNILKHWREYEPKRVEALLSKGILRSALIQKANALWDMQMALEKMERLPPVLAKLEAWNRLMKPEQDEDESDVADYG